MVRVACCNRRPKSKNRAERGLAKAALVAAKKKCLAALFSLIPPHKARPFPRIISLCLKRVFAAARPMKGRKVKRPRIKSAQARKLQPQNLSAGELSAIVRRAQCIDDWSKKFGYRRGLIGESGMKVLRYLVYAFAAKGWSCFPSYRHIAKQVRLARSTVEEALARLRRIGAISWINRRNGRRQGTNLFQVHLAPWKSRLLPVLKRVRQLRKKMTAGAVLVADTVKAVVSRDSSETGNRSQGAMTPFKDAAGAAKISGAASPHRVPDASGASAKPPRTVSSKERSNARRLEAAFAVMGRALERKQTTAKCHL
jgi:hypothetical protein